jgi:ammonium transporter, Amt family
MDSTTQLSNVMNTCVLTNPEDGFEALQCVASTLNGNVQVLNDRLDSLTYAIDVFFLVMASIVMFTMQAGFAMICAGSVRKINVQNTLMKNFLDACGCGLAFFVCGYAFSSGGSLGPACSISLEKHTQTTFIGTENFFLIGVENYSLWLFHFAFAATSTTIVAGALAERSQMGAYFFYSVLLSGFVFPVVAHSVWSMDGFLNASKAERFLGSGMVDFAGSGVVHVLGGCTALIAVTILGPRAGRFHDDRGAPLAEPKTMEPSSVSLQVLGTFLLWFGWYGFNTGSVHFISCKTFADVAALSALNTTLGAASGSVAALGVSAYWSLQKTGEVSFDLPCTLNGCLSGLVAITAGCALFEPWVAMLVGSAGGLLYVGASKTLLHFHIDDGVDAIPVHLFNGIWGVIAVGLFAAPSRMEAVFERSDHVGLLYSWSRGSGDARLLMANLVGILFIVVFVTGIMLPFFLAINYLGWFRADPLEEIVGLDIRYQGHSCLDRELLKHSHLCVLKEQMQARLDNDVGDGLLDDTLPTSSSSKDPSVTPSLKGWHRSGQIGQNIEEKIEEKHSEDESSTMDW